MDLESLGITREDILERAAQKILDWHADSSFNYREYARSIIDKRIDITVDKVIDEEVSRITKGALEDVITQTDIWGNVIGEVCIQDKIIEMTRDYWNQIVDDSGRVKKDSWGNKQTRSQYVFKEYMKQCFDYAIEERTKQVVKETKAALTNGFQEKFKELVKKSLEKAS